MGITKRQIAVDDKGRKIPAKFRLYQIDGELYIEKLRDGMNLLEFVAWKNKQKK